ncbi:MAG: SH3 domain-containing protein [Dehalococcoidia bacterium]
MARTIAVLLLIFATLALLAACNDDSDFLFEDADPGASGTPPFEQRTPQPSPDPSPVGSPLAAGATPVTAFEIEVEETVNLRSEPSTEGGQDTVAGTFVPGEKATVTAHVPGEEVEADNDIWYQLNDGTFVYSGAVKEVAEGAEAEATAEVEETPEAVE